jgi:hypothetical protein
VENPDTIAPKAEQRDFSDVLIAAPAIAAFA